MGGYNPRKYPLAEHDDKRHCSNTTVQAFEQSCESGDIQEGVECLSPTASRLEEESLNS